MSDSVIVAVTALGVAAIEMIGRVLTLWVRARYRWRNGQHDPPSDSPPSSA